MFFVTLGPLLLVQRSTKANRRPGGHVWALALEEQVQALWEQACCYRILQLGEVGPGRPVVGKVGCA